MQVIYEYKIGDEIRVNKKAKAGMPNYVGKIGRVIGFISNGSFDYEVAFDQHTYGKFKEEEIDLYVGGDIMEKNYFEEKGLEIGKLVNKKQAAYGDSIGKTSKLMKVFLEGYKNEDNTYTIPEELLDHILLQVRIIDKQNRIFSNPKGDLMQENPYADTVGYSLLGMRMAEQK
ncbi:YorP family protein [Sporosarcina globispora]|uniref:YorP family protein n=1 Tax=Sporosarcina globispora TaxID=1459 RepID=UPI0006A9A3AE|nr:YorP family protein [Sporosarcina globispora]